MDADLECDTLGWQYVAGCLQDARPFEHMVDLGVESQRFDPDGGYVRRWLPSLARLPTEWIHRSVGGGLFIENGALTKMHSAGCNFFANLVTEPCHE